MNQLNSSKQPLKQQCVDYLLGEMSATDVESFEASLCDAEVSDELLRQSELISAVDSALANTHHATVSRVRGRAMKVSHFVAINLAISVCVVALFTAKFFSKPTDQFAQSRREELLIAQTWIESEADLMDHPIENLSVESSTDFNLDDETLLIDDAETDDEMDELSWIVAAILVDSNDG